MALTATLALDIANFERGLKTAEVSLQGFERASRTVNRDLQRLMTDFSGQNVTIEASRMAEAVERIGGAAMLTQREQARVNAVVTEALAKYRALGQEAPAHLQRLADATTATHGATTRWSGSVGQLAAAIGLGGGLAGAALAATNWVRQLGASAIRTAGDTEDLALSTGLAARTIEQMRYVASQTGTTLDAFTNAAFKLSTQLAGGGTSVEAALAKLGLSLTDVRSLSDDDRFLAITAALGDMEDASERNRVGLELFGRTFKEIAPAISQGYDEMAQAAATMSTETRIALAEAEDAWQGFKTNLTTQIGAAFGQFVIEARSAWHEFDAIMRAMGQAASGRDMPAPEFVERFVGGLGRIPDVAGPATEQLHGLRGATVGVALSFDAVMRESDRLTRALPETARATTAVATTQTTFTGLVSRSLQETGKLTAQLEAWARVNGAVLAPSIRQVNSALESQSPLVSTMQHAWAQFAPTVQQSTTQVEGSTQGFFSRLFGGASGLGQSISSIFQAAFTGGGGALGAVQSFATQGLSALLGMIPGVGSFISAFAGPIVAMFSRLIGKAKEFFRELFGGPSRGELEGRSLVDAFEDTVIASLSATQQAEAGGERWRQIVIAVRDAYLAAGLSAEEAERDVARLWASSREGPAASRAVIDEITRKMQTQGDEAAAAIDRIGDAIDRLPDVVDIDIRGHYQAPDLERPPGPSGVPAVGPSALSALVAPRASVPAGLTMTVPLYLDGRQIAMATVPHIPSALRWRGV